MNCSSDKYQFLKLRQRCPDDSLVAQLSEAETSYCHVENTCVCNECESPNKKVQRCKANGQSFEPVLVSKGIGKPGKCCDIYVCRKLFFTCKLIKSFNLNIFLSLFCNKRLVEFHLQREWRILSQQLRVEARSVHSMQM